jgi:hypothetical protein
MQITEREWWAIIHGMGLGAIFLLAYGGGLSDLYHMLRRDLNDKDGLQNLVRRLCVGTVAMAVVAWMTVISGTWVVYIWYRAKPPAGANLTDYPRSYLLANEHLSGFHQFGMEWKEHVAWLAPVLATAVAFIVIRYWSRLANQPQICRALIVVFTLAFVTAGIAGAFGALITKAAPIH